MITKDQNRTIYSRLSKGEAQIVGTVKDDHGIEYYVITDSVIQQTRHIVCNLHPTWGERFGIHVSL